MLVRLAFLLSSYHYIASIRVPALPFLLQRLYLPGRVSSPAALLFTYRDISEILLCSLARRNVKGISLFHLFHNVRMDKQIEGHPSVTTIVCPAPTAPWQYPPGTFRMHIMISFSSSGLGPLHFMVLFHCVVRVRLTVVAGTSTTVVMIVPPHGITLWIK